ncbi:DUF6176 family protein [Occultella glacieicola]|uniref:DUF6176 family protein n=1 Tax=Occultella glacieicola TaxID=2518684 RepID=UPI001F439BDF|nr:DUF6176 family protein [Occultella glacieicola]
MPIEDEIRDYYDQGREAGRLSEGPGLLERVRTQELLGRLLPPAPAVVLDVGGGPGAYALWLAERGYTVDLLDPVPRHVEEASAASASSATPLRSATLGDARDLPVADASVDVVLMLGPLYHLTEPDDRALALREARRVLRPGGVVVAVGISRFASTLDAIGASHLESEEFAEIVAADVATGRHLNPANVRGWFTTAYFHRPEELTAEVAAAGLDVDGPIAIEGPSGSAPTMADLLDGGAAQRRVLEAIRRIEREPTLIGASAHLMVLGRAPVAGPGPAGDQAGTDAVDRQANTPFRPDPPDAPPHPMPATVPDGLRLELSRARILPGKEAELGIWMQMLTDRYAECQATLPAERAAFEATFKHTEADGSVWMYHLALLGTDGSGLDTSNPVDAAHEAFARRVKERGWEELTPMFLLAPAPILDALTRFGRTGQA